MLEKATTDSGILLIGEPFFELHVDALAVELLHELARCQRVRSWSLVLGVEEWI